MDKRTVCGRCGEPLGAGSSHVDADSCVDALRAALVAATTCDACGAELGETCVPCTAKKRILNKAGEIGTDWFFKLKEGMQGKRKKGDQ